MNNNGSNGSNGALHRLKQKLSLFSPTLIFFRFYEFESSIAFALQNIELEIDGAVWRELLQVILLKSFNPVTSNWCDIQGLERKKFSQNFSVAWCSVFFRSRVCTANLKWNLKFNIEKILEFWFSLLFTVDTFSIW